MLNLGTSQMYHAHAVNAEGVIVYEGLYKFFIRWRSGLDAGMRVKWGESDF